MDGMSCRRGYDVLAYGTLNRLVLGCFCSVWLVIFKSGMVFASCSLTLVVMTVFNARPLGCYIVIIRVNSNCEIVDLRHAVLCEMLFAGRAGLVRLSSRCYAGCGKLFLPLSKSVASVSAVALSAGADCLNFTGCVTAVVRYAATRLLGTAYAALVPVVRIVELELGVIVLDRSLIATDTINVTGVVKIVSCRAQLFAFAANALEPMSVCIVAVFTA